MLKVMSSNENVSAALGSVRLRFAAQCAEASRWPSGLQATAFTLMEYDVFRVRSSLPELTSLSTTGAEKPEAEARVRPSGLNAITELDMLELAVTSLKKPPGRGMV